MFIRNLYYRLKPFIPQPLRLEFRRWRAQQIRQQCAGVWPVLEASGRTPDGWPGWPEGKRFAFVLSHDVEGPKGLARCRQLAELEMQHGFRSVFNFIPDGDYDVPSELIAWLTSNGFEVGVHDLHHDGALFRSESEFRSKAVAINQRLKEWGAVGFRAGFMLHELEWLHQLEVEYDSSTFDVDPFEPQMDGVETIFPFWIPKPDPEADAHPRSEESEACADRGYVELPYTLVQDMNLFVVLQEQTTEVWDRKLEWIARKGGMAFLNTHPDYMAFGGRNPDFNEFPVELYGDFLRRVREQYGESLHHDVPRDVARYIREHRPRHTRAPREICMVSFSAYEYDNRVRRYAEALARRGDRVSVIAIAATTQAVGVGELNGVRVMRVFKPSREERGKLDYLFNYAWFWWKAFCVMQARHFPNGCDLVHVHNMPEALVFAAAALKWRGAKVILDLHDLMPELYQDKFRISDRHPATGLLRAIEAWACRFSHHVIISNHLWKEVVARRSRPDDQLTALINHVDLQLFFRRQRTRQDDRFIIVYPGSLSWHQGLDIAINAMRRVRQAVPKAELHIYGRGSERVNLQNLAKRLGLEQCVSFFKDVPFAEIGTVMANADLGVVPKRADGFGNEAFSTKIMEFMSQGLPVVLSRTKVDRYYFSDDCVCFFNSGDADDLAEKIIALAQDRARREQMVKHADRLLELTSWQAVQSTYLDIVDRLTQTRVPVLQANRTS